MRQAGLQAQGADHDECMSGQSRLSATPPPSLFMLSFASLAQQQLALCCPDARLTRPFPKCDQCHGKFCIKHRYPADHECGRLQAGVSSAKATAAQSRAAQAAMQRHQRKAAASQSTRCALAQNDHVLCALSKETCSLRISCNTSTPLTTKHFALFSLQIKQGCADCAHTFCCIGRR